MPSRPSRRILVTTADIPWRDDTGKRMRSQLLCDVASSFGVLEVLALAAPGQLVVPADVNRRWPGATVRCPPVTKVSMPRGLARVALRRWPGRVAIQDWSGVAESLTGRSFDLAIFGSLDHYLALAPTLPDTPCLVDMDDVESAKSDSLRRSAGGRELPPSTRVKERVERAMWARLERLLVASSAVAIVASDLDRHRLGDAHAMVVPNYYPDVERIDPLPQTENVALVGNFRYPPNVDAAGFAAREVLAQLRQLRPAARLRIIGHGSHELDSSVRTSPGVDVVGSVESVPAALHSCTVSLSPVRFGGGTRIKILEAFACGIPVVATGVGVEGIDAVAGRDLLVADTAAGLAAACDQLLGDHVLALRLADSARLVFERHYSRANSVASLEAAVGVALGQ